MSTNDCAFGYRHCNAMVAEGVCRILTRWIWLVPAFWMHKEGVEAGFNRGLQRHGFAFCYLCMFSFMVGRKHLIFTTGDKTLATSLQCPCNINNPFILFRHHYLGGILFLESVLIWTKVYPKGTLVNIWHANYHVSCNAVNGMCMADSAVLLNCRFSLPYCWQ